MTNGEILQQYMELLHRCCEIQGRKYHATAYDINDLEQDLALILLSYDNERLNRIHEENHMNAFMTGILVNQLYSSSSQFHKDYRKFDRASREITWKEEELPEDYDFLSVLK